MTRRLVQLMLGLTGFGLGLAMLIRAGLGVAPWSVLEVALSRLTGLSVGKIAIIVSCTVLLLWIPLRQRPGLGTVLNAVWVGLVVDASLAVLPHPSRWWWQGSMMIGGVVINAISTAVYIGAQLGPGPRDGLMTGLHQRLGWNIAVVKIGLEVTLLTIGWLLGGPVGLGTVVFASCTGLVMRWALRWAVVPLSDPPQPEPPRPGLRPT